MAEQSQVKWDEARAEAKAKAAITIKEQAEEAKAKLVALRKGEVEVELQDEEEDDEERPYSDYTNEELSGFLKDRGLPHTGNKDELVARLEEDDESE